jgi:predicted esterase
MRRTDGGALVRPPWTVPRRVLLAGAVAALAGCNVDLEGDALMNDPGSSAEGPTTGRLAFRHPGAPVDRVGPTGQVPVQGAAGAPAAQAYVPSAVEDGRALRLVVFLHGAGGTANEALTALRPYADEQRLLLLAPKSTQGTWDVISGGYGPDVENLDRLLDQLSGSYPIRGYTIAGFSDGASYALSLGIGNGDVFDTVMAFSPGFSAAQVRNGRPRFFVSHGTEDKVLPIERCSRRLVPALERAGYDVTYEEFDSGHFMPKAIKEGAVDWLRSDV